MDTTSSIDRADPLIQAAECAGWDRVESLWLERLETPDPAPDPLLETARLLSRAGEKERLKVLASMAAPVLQSKAPHAVLALATIASRAGVDDPDLVEATLTAAGHVYRDHTAGEALVTRADLERGRGLNHVLVLLDAFFRFDVGGLVLHTGGWGMGKVKKLVIRREEIHVLFESGRSHIFPMRTAGEYLSPIPSDHIDALVRRDPSALTEEARSDPMRLITRAVEGRGGVILGKELKALLVPAVLSDGDWGAWWSGARDRIRKDPYFEIEAGANPRITRREIPRSYADETLTRFERLNAFWDKAKVLREYTKTVKRREAEAPFVTRAYTDIQAKAKGTSENLACYFLGEDLKAIVPDLSPSPFPETLALASLREVLEPFLLPEFKVRLLAEVRARYPETWLDTFTDLLFVDDPEVIDPVVERLLKEGHRDRVEAKLPGLFSDCREAPWAFLWFFNRVAHGHYTNLAGIPGPTDLVDMILDIHHGALTQRLKEGPEARKIVAKARATLTEAILIKAFEGVSNAVAKRLWHRIKTEGLTRGLILRAQKIVAKRFPELIVVEEDHTEEDKVIWSTAAGLAKRHREYDHLINVELPKNAEDLGRAIAMGDLSENAEYDAAREEQGRLTERARQMEE
ncbi:MAG: hypothetical protein ACYTHN_15210, partial [Planctomycetota bacterium]